MLPPVGIELFITIYKQRSHLMNINKGNFNDWAKAHYLDASAIIKLLIDIPEENIGREALRAYFYGNANFHMTSLCFAEALGVLKVKCFYHKKIKEEDYLTAIENLIWGRTIIDDVPIKNYNILQEAKKLISDHQLDLSDAMQIVTIMRGTYSILGLNSQSILITADTKLANAARAEGARVWNCSTESKPG